MIPILNIYYLLSYAWNKLDEAGRINAGISDYRQIVDLFARLLINGCNHIFARGLDRDYVAIAEPYPGVRGKINFTESINGMLFKQGKAFCEFDEFQPNIIQNQILKATLYTLSRIGGLDLGLKKECSLLYWRFQNVDDVKLTTNDFMRARIHRNNSFYDLLLRICRIVFEVTTLNENGDGETFRDFLRDEKAMQRLFEEFVRNFYRKELPAYRVGSPKIYWDAQPIGNSSADLLPEMRTDICLESADRKIVIDTKYYRNSVPHNWNTEKFHSGNLYQIFTYLKNLETDQSNPLNANVSGVLMYPTVGKEYDQSYLIQGHTIRIVTVDLGREWREIEVRLKQIVA